MTYKPNRFMKNKQISFYASELGRLGGTKTLKKYGKRKMKEWGKQGGRPKKIEVEAENALAGSILKGGL